LIRKGKRSQAEDLDNSPKLEVEKDLVETNNVSGDQNKEIRDDGEGNGEEVNHQGAK